MVAKVRTRCRLHARRHMLATNPIGIVVRPHKAVSTPYNNCSVLNDAGSSPIVSSRRSQGEQNCQTSSNSLGESQNRKEIKMKANGWRSLE